MAAWKYNVRMRAGRRDGGGRKDHVGTATALVGVRDVAGMMENMIDMRCRAYLDNQVVFLSRRAKRFGDGAP